MGMAARAATGMSGSLMTDSIMTGSFSLPASVRRFERLLVVRLSAMGDIIHTLPAAAALRQAFPTLPWDG